MVWLHLRCQYPRREQFFSRIFHRIQQPIPKLRILNFHKLFANDVMKNDNETRKICFNWSKNSCKFRCSQIRSFGISCWIQFERYSWFFRDSSSYIHTKISQFSQLSIFTSLKVLIMILWDWLMHPFLNYNYLPNLIYVLWPAK